MPTDASMHIKISRGAAVIPIDVQERPPFKRRIFALKEKDIERILRAENVEIERIATTKDRNRLIVRLLIATGLRVSELANLRVEDIDLENGEIIVVSGKGGKQRIVLVDLQTISDLKKFIQDRDPKALLIGLKARQIENVVKRYAIAAGVKWAEYVSPHRLRDTFAVHWVRSQGDLESLRRLLGHSSLSSTQKYLVFDFNEVRATYDRVFGKKQERRLYG